MPTVGERIKSLRTAKTMSAEMLAAKIKVAPASIYRYESGETQNIPAKTLLAIASELGTTVDFLLGKCENPEEQMYTDLEWKMMSDVDDMITFEHLLIRFGYSVVRQDMELKISKGKNSYSLNESQQLSVIRDMKRYLGFLLSEQ